MPQYVRVGGTELHQILGRIESSSMVLSLFRFLLHFGTRAPQRPNLGITLHFLIPVNIRAGTEEMSESKGNQSPTLRLDDLDFRYLF